MESILLLVILAGVAAVILKVRGDASRERKAVMARLASEQEHRGDYSPTAELFREAGAPAGAIAEFTAAAPTPTPAASRPAPTNSATGIAVEGPASDGDLAVMFSGIRMPAGLAPLGAMSRETVTFASERPAAEVGEGLAAELDRIEATVAWLEPTLAQVERGGQHATLAIYPRPDTAVDLAGNRLFPTAPIGTCVVRLTLR